MIEERIRKLEQSNRRLRLGMTGLVLVLVSLVAMGQDSAPVDKLKAKKIVLVDDDGREGCRIDVHGIEIRVGEDKSVYLGAQMDGLLGLNIFDDSPRVQLVVGEHSTGIQLNGPSVKDRINLDIYDSGPKVSVMKKGVC